MHSLEYLKQDLITIESFLNISNFSNLQRNEREIENVFLFHPIFLNVKERKIEGFLWEPHLADLFYEIDLSRQGVPTIDFVVGSENRLHDIARIEAEIPKLRTTAEIRKAAMGRKGGGGKGKKGFYLEVGTAKETALANFEAAVKCGVGSRDFVNFCVPRDFKMKYCEGSRPA